MKLETWQRDRNERCMERHQLSIERLQMIVCRFFAQTGITSQNNRRPQF